MWQDTVKKSFKINREEQESFTFLEIEEGVYFRGHNLWLLVLSMAIACIGLNTNSSAAVIGAMLISPLMGPVVGLAFGLSIGNQKLIKISIYNWIIMILTSLLASTLYFLLSPFHSETSQLSTFKTASVFDCLLALFGGFALFLGITRKEAIKVIAGVAVATACIPPLCTAGYGLANLNAEYFFGGLYFYLINCFFIGAGAWILSVVLGYQKHYLKEARAKNGRHLIITTIAAIAILIPSVILTQKKWKQEKFKEDADAYILKIQTELPDLAIINHIQKTEGGKQYLDITVLNDESYAVTHSLLKADMLNKDIHLRWHYASDYNSNAEIKYLQQQIDELKNALDSTAKSK